MKFIIFAILSAIASFSIAAPAPKPGQCVPEQGHKYSDTYDITGWYQYDQCTWTSLYIETGVLHTRGAYNWVQEGSQYTFCSKGHANMAGAKAVDDQGNRYNVQQISGYKDESTYDYSVPSYDSHYKYTFKYKLVGHGQLSNSVVTFSYDCHYSYDPTNGYQYECKKDDFSMKCGP
jgi:hypothetical protein